MSWKAWILWSIPVAAAVVVLTWLPSYGREARVDGRKQVDVWSWNIAAHALDAVSDDFEAMHPDVAIVVERNGTMLQSRLLLSLVAGKGGPDVAQLQEREAKRFSATGRLVDLTEWAAGYADDFPPSFWDSALHEGRVYAVPWDIGPCAVFYKQWVFDEYGIDPAAIETWDDFIRVGEDLARRSGGATRMLPISAGEAGEFFQLLMQQNGGGVFDADGRIILHRPENVEALALLGRLLASPATRSGSMLGPEFFAGLSTDSVACYVSASWQSQNIKDNAAAWTHGEWGVFRLPAFRPGGLRNSNFGGSVLVVPEGATQPEAAADFIEYALCTVPGQIEQFEKFGLFPAFLPAHDHPYFAEPDPFFGGQKVNALFARDFEEVPPLVRTQDWTEAERLLRQSLARYANDRPDEAAFLVELAHTLAAQTGRELADESSLAGAGGRP